MHSITWAQLPGWRNVCSDWQQQIINKFGVNFVPTKTFITKALAWAKKNDHLWRAFELVLGYEGRAKIQKLAEVPQNRIGDSIRQVRASIARQRAKKYASIYAWERAQNKKRVSPLLQKARAFRKASSTRFMALSKAKIMEKLAKLATS